MQLIRKIVRHIARGVMKKRSKRGRARSDRDVAAAARPAAELPVSPELKWTVAMWFALSLTTPTSFVLPASSQAMTPLP